MSDHNLVVADYYIESTYKDEQGNVQGSLLDKVCLEDNSNFNYSVKK